MAKIVWMKKGTDSITVPGQTLRAWSSRDGKHTKVRITRRGPEQKTATLVSLKVNGTEIGGLSTEQRRAHVQQVGLLSGVG